MVRWIFAKGFVGFTLFAGAAIFYAERTEYLSIPQLVLALAGFLVLALVTMLLNAKPNAASAQAKVERRARADMKRGTALTAKIKRGKGTEKDMLALKSVATEFGVKIPKGPNPHEGPAVVLARHRRDQGFDVTRDGTSWFGGLPALGGADWPNATSGRPMTPLVQIDLATVASKMSIPGLPTTGSLAFFVNASEGPLQGAVRYNPEQAAQPTAPPSYLYPLEDGFVGGPMRLGEPAETQVLYPRMAIEMAGLTSAEMADHDMLQGRMTDLFGPGREYSLGVSSFPDQFPAKDKPINRDCVARFARGAELSLANGEKARVKLEKQNAEFRKRLAGLEPRLPELRVAAQASDTDGPAVEAYRIAQSKVSRMNERADLIDYELAHFDEERLSLRASVTALNDWAARGDRWAMLTAAEQAEIAPLLLRWTDYGALGQLHLDGTRGVHRSMQQAADETFRVMAVSPDSVFAALPKPVQAAVDGPYRLPTDHLRHQMFGSPSSIQSAAEDYSDHALLLQIQTDDLQAFGWGDMGVLQFWIRPRDLANGKWSAVKVSCESH